MELRALPINVPPARHETLASYLVRLAALHGLPVLELWATVAVLRPGTNRRGVASLDRLAEITGHRPDALAAALPELRDPAPDWTAWRHEAQPGCPRCDARHDGGPVHHLLPHHTYVCTRHRYWIGPPDAGQPTTHLDSPVWSEIVAAQRRHRRLLHRHGAAATFDAVLTGMLVCGHLWDQQRDPMPVVRRWERRVAVLIPPGDVHAQFSASRLFAAVYPEAIRLAELIADPRWRRAATEDTEERARFIAEVGRWLGDPHYRPREGADAIGHWMHYDASQPPSRPTKSFPDTRAAGAATPPRVSPQSEDRHDRSAAWFAVNHRGGSVILHHRHIRPVLIRDWSTPMDGINAAIWASQTIQSRDRPGAVRWPSRDRSPVTV